MTVSPTITAYEPHAYRSQMELVESFADRIHIDLMDGEFAPHKSVGVDQIWWSESTAADIHLMYKKPMEQLEALIKLRPHMVIFHYEAEGDPAHIATHLREAGIKAGLALLQQTSVDEVKDVLPCFDHVLVFSGNLGEHGGFADLRLLEKVKQLRELKPDLEISWDGGINYQNAAELVKGGVDVLNAGGYIHNAPDPAAAYKLICAV